MRIFESIKKTMKKVIILGASGLVGSEVLKLALNNNEFDEVKIFVRKPLPIKNPKLTQILTNFDELDLIKSEINAEIIFCCLGSTKSKTPNLQDYKKIDHDYPLYFAKEGLKNNLSQFHIISALGANPNSSNFYTKLKGEIEDALKGINIPSLYIYRPSFLVGKRKEKRPLEKIALLIMRLINPLLMGRLKKYQTIDASIIAKAMINESIKNKRGIFVLESDKIKELA
jgi:uncharacterized protein YbjT (DUF2867 family)